MSEAPTVTEQCQQPSLSSTRKGTSRSCHWCLTRRHKHAIPSGSFFARQVGQCPMQSSTSTTRLPHAFGSELYRKSTYCASTSDNKKACLPIHYNDTEVQSLAQQQFDALHTFSHCD